VVFDEAHEMEDVASGLTLAGRFETNRFEELARDADLSMRLLHLGTPSLLRRTQRIASGAARFFDAFPARDGRYPFERNRTRGIPEATSRNLRRFDECVEGNWKPNLRPWRRSRKIHISRRSFEIPPMNWHFFLNRMNAISFTGTSAETRVFFLAATPIDVSQFFALGVRTV